MRFKSIFGRPQILIIGFITTIIALYKLADTSFITKATKPITYYRNNDYPVCLPKKYLSQYEPKKKAKAAFVILVRNNELDDIIKTIENLQDKFNRNFKYPFVFLNDQPFTDVFKTAILSTISTKVEFGLIPKEHWGYPDWIDQEKAAIARKEMDENGIYLGGLENYHHMCRYYAGFFFDHPLLQKYDWYWRIEPGVKFFCDITYDPFLYMERTNKQYGFVITLTELKETIPTLWNHVLNYTNSRRIDIKNNKKLAFPYFMDENDDYNTCHFWSNFEIGSLNFWRSSAYRDFFNYLDRTGNFFYERWGDAPVHSLAAGLLLDTDQIHYFEDIGYQHDSFRHCPKKSSNLDCRCNCPVGTSKESIDRDVNWDTCLSSWKEWIQIDKARKAE